MLDGRAITQMQDPANPGDSPRLMPLAALALLLSPAGFATINGLPYRLNPDGATWQAHAAVALACSLAVALSA